MTYGEIEEVLRDHGHSSTIEQLRAAVGAEALELKNGLKGKLEEKVAIEQAREFYAEDITRWITEEADLDPTTLIGMRSRYAKSWAFAQIIGRIIDAEAAAIHVPEVDPDTLVRICIANAELGTKVVELVEMVQNPLRELPHPSHEVFRDIGRALDAAGAPKIAAVADRALSPLERLEALIEDMANAASMEAPCRTCADLAKDVMELAKNLCWIADRVHQGYHGDESSVSWKECTKGICGSMEHMLAQAGFNKELKPGMRAV